MLTPVGAGITAEALITVGETGDEGYVFEAIPDGIALRTRGNGTAEVFVNHETSRVPFPYPLPPGTPTAANAQNDFDNAQLSRLILNQKGAGVQTGKLVITSDENYQRFCSNYLATLPKASTGRSCSRTRRRRDWVNRDRQCVADDRRRRDGREAGVVVAYDVRRARTAQSGAWAGTTTRIPSRSPGSTSSCSCRGTTRSRRRHRSPSSIRTSHRTPTRSGTIRARCGRSCRTSQEEVRRLHPQRHGFRDDFEDARR